MARYDEIKKKAKDALETIADVSVEAYKLAEDKAKVFAKRAKLNAEITREKSLIRRIKLNIGGTYYDLHNEDPGEAFKQDCDNISASLDRIATKRRELEDLKRTDSCDEECCDEECCADECAEECVEECEPAPEGEDAEPKEE